MTQLSIDKSKVAFASVTTRVVGIRSMPGSDVTHCGFLVTKNNIYSATTISDLLLTLSVSLFSFFFVALAVCFGSSPKLQHGVKDRGIYNGHMEGEYANVPVTESTLDTKQK